MAGIFDIIKFILLARILITFSMPSMYVIYLLRARVNQQTHSFITLLRIICKATLLVITISNYRGSIIVRLRRLSRHRETTFMIIVVVRAARLLHLN